MIPLLSSLAFAQATASPDPVLAIQTADAELSDVGFTLSFLLNTAASATDPTQGARVVDGLYAQNASHIGIRTATSYRTPPVHQRIGSYDYEEQDFDPSDRLIHWRAIAQESLSTPSFNVSLLTVSKDKTSERDDYYSGATPPPVQHFFRYNPGTNEGHVLEGQALMIAGRGFGKWLDRTLSAEPGGEGLVEVIAQGNFGPTAPGIWTLLCEPDARWLVRRASFTQGDEDAPRILVSNLGYLLLDGRPAFAKEGTFRHTSLPEYATVQASIQTATLGTELLDELELEMILQPKISVQERDRRR